MIKGRYELKLQFDIENKIPKKELKTTGIFGDSTEFLAALLADLQASGPYIAQYVPAGGTDDAEIHI